LSEAEASFSRAVAIKPNLAEPHTNLGNVYRVMGRFDKAENSLRRALKLQPGDEIARNALGMSLLAMGRPQDAKVHFGKVLKTKPRSLDALVGMGQITGIEGDFSQAEGFYKRALEIDPNMVSALSNLAGLRRMTLADSGWLERVKELAGDSTDPVNEANLRYAMGKYYDDVGQFDAAFASYQRANELMKTLARNYQRDAHESFVDDLIGVYTRDLIAAVKGVVSDSMLPVFVVGMPRSGTSLVEQIIASHPAACGAGELTFWTRALREHEAMARQGLLPEPVRRKLAEEYQRQLRDYSADAQRIVDKAPANSEYLGVIHSVFPNARIIHMRRDPIDTCLSCYFQQFSAALSYTLDLADLAHYYRQFHRIMAHWHAVLPPGTILDVPYEQLVADQEGWTRKILQFVGLEWHERCLNFQSTHRTVATASAWQVRQKIYRGSVERWRNYSKFIGPLRELKELGA
jgi:tetratricopeptide (TPR) repeat protein